MNWQSVVSGVPASYDPSEVPLYPDRETIDEQYETAQSDGEPFFGIERYEDGYAITYDLLPAGFQLAEPAVSELQERLTHELEAIVADENRPTTDVGHSIGDSLGQLSFFEREETAREIAATMSTIVLDEENWVTATPPTDEGSAYYRN